MAIVTSRMQTTRHRIKGIVNGENFQIIYSDTPGILLPHYRLQATMLRVVEEALSDADVLLYVTDVEETADKQPAFLDRIAQTKVSLFVLINKIDLSSQKEVLKKVEQWSERWQHAKIFPVSALHSFNTDSLFQQIVEKLPIAPPFFEKDVLTDRSQRFFAQEIIREQILFRYREEIPYVTEVEIDEFKEEDTLIRLFAFIYVARESQKKILIGAQGKAIKQLSIQARRELTNFFGKKIFLESRVKVLPNWRDKRESLRRFGYEK